ncbi:hypothetical protein ACS0TY_026606 [Phlomoides rotata]
MKGIDIFCASQAATAILHPMNDPSSSSSSAVLLGGGSSSPAIDRCNPIIADSRRSYLPPPPIPKPHKNRKNQRTPRYENSDQVKKIEEEEISTRKSWSCTRPGDFISPPGSTRYLLSEKVLINAFSDSKVNAIQPVDAKPPSPSLSPNQVVVLRVSLHCRGCERKMRKHISRMEGVSSFNIDFAAKKVTVTGNVTPLEVLSSISKVKNAQLWSPSLASSSPLMNLNEFKGADAWVMDKGTFAEISS